MTQSLILKGEEIHLLPEKVVWWPATSSMLLADLHFGKAGHFRKSGIPVPRQLEQEDLATLSDLNGMFKPADIYILGDMVHSELNSDWLWLRLWRQLISRPRIHLILGNHDIVPQKYFAELDIEVVSKALKLGPFLLRHFPLAVDELPRENEYLLSGHIHPGVELRGKAKQSVVLPCFYFGEFQGILPAFGRFTGTSRIPIIESDRIFAVSGGKVICV